MSLRIRRPASPASDLRDLVAVSRELITHHQAASGAFPAAPTYPVYHYSWFRDGAFIADGLSRHGETEAADAFHDWCAAVLLQRREQVDAVLHRLHAGVDVPRDDFLPTRYTLDGGDGTEEWENFQTDGYGSWLWALRQHLRRHSRAAAHYREPVDIAARYLCGVWRRPCYDWWEEHPDQVHTSTLGAIAAGLEAALDLGVLESATAQVVAAALRGVRDKLIGDAVDGGHAVKWIGSRAVDGSLLSCVAPFRVLDFVTARATVEAVERDLVFEHGVYRYLGDTFYGGGRWPVLAAFRGLALAAAGSTDDAAAALSWIASTATEDGYLPEQVGPRLLHPEREAGWIERWGPVATPLLWSHGMFLMLADELGVRA